MDARIIELNRMIAFVAATIKVMLRGKAIRGFVKMINPLRPESRNDRLIHIESLSAEKSLDAEMRDRHINA